MDAKDNPYVFDVPNPVAEKSRRLAPGDTPASATDKADANLAKLEEHYIAAIEENIEAMARLLAKASELDAVPADLVGRVQRLCVDEVKSQAGTFDYALASLAAHRLDRFLEVCPLVANRDTEIAREHVSFIRAIVKGRVKGQGGRLEGEALDALARLADARMAQTASSGGGLA